MHSLQQRLKKISAASHGMKAADFQMLLLPVKA
jgi:hypothetical protein